MKNLYPLTEEYHTLEYVIDRFRVHKIFPGYNEFEIGDLILKHYKQELIDIYEWHKGKQEYTLAPVGEMLNGGLLEWWGDDFGRSVTNIKEVYLQRCDIDALETGNFTNDSSGTKYITKRIELMNALIEHFNLNNADAPPKSVQMEQWLAEQDESCSANGDIKNAKPNQMAKYIVKIARPTTTVATPKTPQK